MYLKYFAANDFIKAGHTDGVEYTIEFEADVINITDMVDREVSTSMSGKEEVIYNRYDSMWQINAVLIQKADLEDWREFIHSVKTGETFTIDPDALTLTPVNPLTVTIQSNVYQPARQGTSDWFTLSFQVKEYV